MGDTIYGLQGDDRIRANTFTNDRDILYGNRGNDRLNALDGDDFDTLRGGPGYDRCVGDAGDEYISCEVINGVVQ